MFKRLSLIALVAVLAASGALLIHCGDDQGSQGEFCESDSDCRGEMVCRENVCVEPEVNPCEPPCNSEVEVCHHGECVIIADADDKDGDGSLAAEDCDDYDRTTHPDAFEYCDGADNDCDSETDEGCPSCESGSNRSCGTDLGECTPGDQTCTGGRWDACSGQGSAPEKCDGLDNDCDGRTDENCPCDDGDEFPCGNDEGECSAGVEICENGAWPGCLNGQLPADYELCDGLDNDCDGLTDEGFELGTACSFPGECGDGVLECFADLETGCSSGPGGSADGSAAELCNQLDDDCDGETDEDFTGLGLPCDGDDSDSCENGTFTCAPDGAGIECVNETAENIAEICNQQDDDCDGQTDEDFADLGLPCDGDDSDSCENGTLTCTSDGAGVECVNETTENIAEICNGLDDDCDGNTDEDFPNLDAACDGADSDSCRNGTFTCTADGSDLECINESIEDIVEVCNGQDDDCDGTTDNNIPENHKPACAKQLGVCAGSKKSCVNGDWRECTFGDYEDNALTFPPKAAGRQPTRYVESNSTEPHCYESDGVTPRGFGEGQLRIDCDGYDNDCDGLTDEGISCDNDHDDDWNAVWAPVCVENHQVGQVFDCCDTDEWTFPSQTNFYADERDDCSDFTYDCDECGGYDYNCSGAEEKQGDLNVPAVCVPTGLFECGVVQAGYAGPIPDCGNVGTTWISHDNQCAFNSTTMQCEPIPSLGTPMTMRCR